MIVVLVLATLAAWPFLSRPSLPQYTDAEHHIYRTFEVLSAWQAGVWYPRWAPDLYHAYGYPVFHYYAPLMYYLAAGYGALIGGPVAGVKFVLVLAVYLGAVGTYLFARELWGAHGGLIASVVYTFSPYLVFVDPHQRGAVPETLALGLGPWLFWAVARLQRAPSGRRVAVAALVLAALSLSHNLMSFAFLGIKLLWVVWEQVWGELPANGASRRTTWLALAAAVGLGLGASAFMWLPAALESQAVQFSRATVNTLLDIWKTFIPLGQLFAPAAASDMFDVLYPKIGIAQWGLGLVGLLSAWKFRERRATLALFASMAVGMIGLMLSDSRPLWERLPFLLYLQFPYRLLGPLMLVLAVLAGAAARWTTLIPARWGATALSAVAMIAGAALALPYLDPLPWPDFGPVSAARIFLMERNWGIGTTANDEFLPTKVLSVPGPTASLLDSYATGIVDKVNRATLPAGTEVVVEEHGPQQDRFHVTGSADFPLRLYTFYWPGWTAYVDGVRTNIDIGEPEGWIVVPVPAGDHQVLVRLEDTPARLLGWAVSALAVIVALALAFWPRLNARQRVEAPRLETTAAGALVALALVLLAGRAGLDSAHWWRVRWVGPAVPGAQTQQFTPLEHNIDFLAYDLPQTSAQPGQQVALKLYWRARDVVPTNWRVFVHVIGPDGKLWGQSDKLHPGGTGVWMSGIPTSRWPLDRYFPDPHTVLIQPDAPPGDYRLIAGLWDEGTGERLRVLGADGQPTDQDGVVLGAPFKITQP